MSISEQGGMVVSRACAYSHGLLQRVWQTCVHCSSLWNGTVHWMGTVHHTTVHHNTPHHTIARE